MKLLVSLWIVVAVFCLSMSLLTGQGDWRFWGLSLNQGLLTAVIILKIEQELREGDN